MKNALPLILYIGIVGSAMVFFGIQRESTRNVPITYSQQISGDYYLYKRENKLIYIATKTNKDVWGKETVKPCVYEMAAYKDFILAKSHPINYSFSDAKVIEGLSKELYKEIKVDSTRTVYSLVNMSQNKVTTLPEWALFEMELTKCSIPVNIQFTVIKDK